MRLIIIIIHTVYNLSARGFTILNKLVKAPYDTQSSCLAIVEEITKIVSLQAERNRGGRYKDFQTLLFGGVTCHNFFFNT